MNRTEFQKMWIADNGNGTYTNPILYSDYSDPDVIRVGENYFMVASSFCNTPAIPLLHSRDLVNWKVINYILDRLPSKRYDAPIHGGGVWAPSIRFHQGVYYVVFPMSDEGIWMCRTGNPFGKWSEPVCIQKATGWIDPCPFWDMDGKAYMINAFAKSRIGFNSRLYLSPMAPDASKVLDDGDFVFNGKKSQPIIEGPKLYRRNGYYYIFAPAGGVSCGWQTVLRSRNIYGPYEEKIVLRQGNTDVNGPHQGAWVDTPEGENWFIHFQDVGCAGRIIHLEPMRWENDWPIIGQNAKDGCGEPVLSYRKPTINACYPADAPDDSDFFEGRELGLQWQWNANYKTEWYQLQKEGLILYAQPSDPTCQLCDVPNLLLQKWPAPDFRITACLNLEKMDTGDAAGMVSLGGRYTDLFIKKEKNWLKLQQRTGILAQKNEKRTDLRTIAGNVVYIRMIVEKASIVSFAFSCNGIDFEDIGSREKAVQGRWVGVKAGLAAIHEDGPQYSGSITAKYFVFEANQN